MSKTNSTPVGGLKKSKKAKGSKKGRKIGRNKVKCERYRLEGRREKNKARKAAKRSKKMVDPSECYSAGGAYHDK
jgi:hypothetical protein